MNATGSSNDVGFEAASPRSQVGAWQVADIALELAEVTIGGSTDEPDSSVLTLGVEALQRERVITGMTTIGRLIQLVMGVTNMEESKKFYADLLGFAVTQDYGKGDAHWVNLSLPDGGATLTLTTYLGDLLQPGTMSLYFAAPDIQQAFDEVTAKGVKPTDEISDDLFGPGSGVKWFRFTDPDGNVLTIAQS